MAFVHGKDSVIFLNENNLSQYFNNVDFNRTADIAETNAFGNDEPNTPESEAWYEEKEEE